MGYNVKGLIKKAINNNYFRHVLETGDNMQVVIMSLKPDEDIGEEVHPDNEQLLICISGKGKYQVNGKESMFTDGDLVLVHAGQRHNFINSGSTDMKILTIYSPPHHKDATIHRTKSDANRIYSNQKVFLRY